MKVNADVSVSRTPTTISARVSLELDAPSPNYGTDRQPVIGALEKAFVQTRQTAVALLKDSTPPAS